jgi:hypothetical protein
MPSGKILRAADYGTVWQLFYLIDGNGMGTVSFDHRPFARFYEGATGSSFFEDYRFGAGRAYVSTRLKDVRVVVEGTEFVDQTIRLES